MMTSDKTPYLKFQLQAEARSYCGRGCHFEWILQNEVTSSPTDREGGGVLNVLEAHLDVMGKEVPSCYHQCVSDKEINEILSSANISNIAIQGRQSSRLVNQG